MEDTISNTDSLEELYHMLLGRSIIETSCHIDRNPSVNVIINNALKNPSHDIKMISNKISDILQGNSSIVLLVGNTPAGLLSDCTKPQFGPHPVFDFLIQAKATKIGHYHLMLSFKG